MNHLVDGLRVPDAKWLPIIAAYVDKLGIVETVNRMCPAEGCDVSPGHMADAMRKFGETDMLYAGDSALVSPANFDLMNDPKTGCRFVTRLPAKYTECKQAIARAVDADAWTDLGTFSNEPDSSKRPRARYRVFETAVVLYERSCRVPV